MGEATAQASAPGTRERLLRAAADLLSQGGRDAVSTRAVSAAAGVQAPTLYRVFGDKEGLLDAVAEYGFHGYLAEKQALARTDDPVADLRRSWDLHVEFGLSMPAYYRLIYGDARAAKGSAARSVELLRDLVARVASAGRLRMSVERATRLMHANGVGVVFTLLADPPEERDQGLSALARDSVMRAITTDGDEGNPAAGPATVAGRAGALRDPGSPALTAGERALLTEWLDRLADAPEGTPGA
ncbi:helix-turn-helix domain-containing protein [Streptomyces sp. MI02-7b]|uniref:TetR/AcrR family transcriptional regulator n=1 Tax=Streptomyces sp. MI02-7b TaxID=462941 RepID=UPI0029B925F3|nr:helix-turn-helix domain-containing protein [Streptomyces sp. MI02-7b]MDX3077172.1 helix-turn-helix domain containing protein [Streptomyces sp. MI02-7b]